MPHDSPQGYSSKLYEWALGYNLTNGLIGMQTSITNKFSWEYNQMWLETAMQDMKAI